MIRIHPCEWLEMWCADPRVPIEFEEEPPRYALVINADTKIPMAYCPCCGTDLEDSKRSASRSSGLCEHIQELVVKPGSSVKYESDLQEFWLFGAEDVKVRLFFCPICGQELPIHNREDRFWQKSQSEVIALTKLFAGINTIDQALKQFGQPDFVRGPVEDFVYWKGKRTRVDCGRSLLYQGLARTVDVHVIEAVGGKVTVKFYAKAKESTDSSTQLGGANPKE